MTTDDQVSADSANPASPQRFWAGRSALIMPALLITLGVFLIWGIVDMEVADDSEIFGPKAFPAITAGLCFVVAALLTVSILRNPELGGPEQSSNWRAAGITIGSLVAFAVLLQPAGWIIAGAVVFWGVTVGLGSTRYVPNILIGLGASSVMQLIFSGLLGLNLPAGVMGLF
ncbi:tripartite tricarboxylate transporter TctB family protein [Mycobacterium sp. smrl_JER01]|uniref:tripartite tricarboxylate transporter TctB family protein n=1 Tax=Mycobacterium sp. smrl_JER01 TaxID=3402633 RepID=UPI003AD455A1